MQFLKDNDVTSCISIISIHKMWQNKKIRKIVTINLGLPYLNLCSGVFNWTIKINLK